MKLDKIFSTEKIRYLYIHKVQYTIWEEWRKKNNYKIRENFNSVLRDRYIKIEKIKQKMKI